VRARGARAPGQPELAGRTRAVELRRRPCSGNAICARRGGEAPTAERDGGRRSASPQRRPSVCCDGCRLRRAPRRAVSFSGSLRLQDGEQVRVDHVVVRGAHHGPRHRESRMQDVKPTTHRASCRHAASAASRRDAWALEDHGFLDFAGGLRLLKRNSEAEAIDFVELTARCCSSGQGDTRMVSSDG
jgi:hypothetical protein